MYQGIDPVFLELKTISVFPVYSQCSKKIQCGDNNVPKKLQLVNVFCFTPASVCFVLPQQVCYMMEMDASTPSLVFFPEGTRVLAFYKTIWYSSGEAKRQYLPSKPHMQKSENNTEKVKRLQWTCDCWRAAGASRWDDLTEQIAGNGSSALPRAPRLACGVLLNLVSLCGRTNWKSLTHFKLSLQWHN